MYPKEGSARGLENSQKKKIANTVANPTGKESARGLCPMCLQRKLMNLYFFKIKVAHDFKKIFNFFL